MLIMQPYSEQLETQPFIRTKTAHNAQNIDIIIQQSSYKTAPLYLYLYVHLNWVGCIKKILMYPKILSMLEY